MHIWREEWEGFRHFAEVQPDSFLLCGRNLFSVFEMKKLVAASLKSAP